MLTKAFATHWVQHQLTSDYSDSIAACPSSVSAFLLGRRPSSPSFFTFRIWAHSWFPHLYIHAIHFIHNCNSKIWHIRLVRLTAGLNPQSSSKVESNYFYFFCLYLKFRTACVRKYFRTLSFCRRCFFPLFILFLLLFVAAKATRAWKLRGGKFLFSCRCSVNSNCS